jgi:polyisoprenyl-teichoic acid--peptidoglycan teichoic acid transferase
MKLKKLLFIMSLLFIAFASAIGIYAYSQLNKIKNVKISKNDEDLGISTKTLEFEDTDINIGYKTDYILPWNENYINEVRNIALFGIDTGRDIYDVPHSDSIIIVTIDPERKKIKLSSILRDTYVRIKGHGKSKLTDAYAYGGPQLALRTLNENFGLNVRDYITVDFFTLEKTIDILGGVDVEVSPEELSALNYRITEAASLQNKPPTLLNYSGHQNLNGIQSVAYCRIRNTASGDFERTSRQRVVLSKLINKAQSSGIVKFHLLASEIFPLIETSLSNSDILSLGSQVIATGITQLEQQRFPVDGYCKGEVIKGVWYLDPKPGIETTREQVVNYIFKDKKPVPKAPLF